MRTLTNEDFANGWKSALKGITVSDIMSMDREELRKLDTKNLSKVVSRVVSAGNKRITSLEKKGLYSSVVSNWVGDTGVRLSVKGMDKAQLLREWNSAKNILQAESTTVKGNIKARDKIIERFKSKGINIVLTTEEKKSLKKPFKGESKEAYEARKAQALRTHLFEDDEKTFWRCLNRLEQYGFYQRRMNTNEATQLIDDVYQKERTPQQTLENLLHHVRSLEVEQALQNDTSDDEWFDVT